ncbi:MAG: hypothetical protein EPO68_09975, partial [Planctomycetota bacterium]
MKARALGSLLLALVTGCANVAEQQREAAAAATARIEERVGERYEGPGANGETDDGALDARALALLDAGLTETTAVRIALLNQREVRALLERLGISSAELARAGRPGEPVLSASVVDFDSGTEFELGIVQPLLDVLRLPARRERARREHAQAEAATVRAIVGLVYDVRRAYTSALWAERAVEIEREILRSAQAAHELMLELHGAGNVTDVMLTAERLSLSEARLAVARAESAARVAREPLNALLGLWGRASGWRFAADGEELRFDADSLTNVETRAIAASLDLEASGARIDALAAAVGVESWEALLPSAEAGLALRHSADLDETGVGPSLALGLPLFGAGAAARAGAKSALRAALAEHVALAVRVRAAARMLRERAVAASEQSVFLRDQHVPELERFVTDTLRNY